MIATNFQVRLAHLEFELESALVVLSHSLDFYAHHKLEDFPPLSLDWVSFGDVATLDDGLDRGPAIHFDQGPSPPFPSSGACWKFLRHSLYQKAVVGDLVVGLRETSGPLLPHLLIVRQTQLY